MVTTGLQNYYVQALAVDAARPSTIYAGTRGGVYKSVDGGDHWAMKRHGFPPLAIWDTTAPVAAVAIDPTDSRHLLAGIGDPPTRPMGCRGGGIYVSHDAGETWKPISSPATLTKAQVYSIVFSPHRPQLVVTATSGGLFRSSDGGWTWAKSGTGMPSAPATGLCADSRRRGMLYATFFDDRTHVGGIAKSGDSGRTWRVVHQRKVDGYQFWQVLADPNRADTLYAAIATDPGILKTTDGGKHWQCVTRDDNVRSAWFDRGFSCTAFAIDPRDSRRLYYANDMDIYATDDSTHTWHQIATDQVRQPGPEERASWRGRGFETTCSSAIAIAPGYPNLLYFGYWDTGLWVSVDGGRTLSWSTDWMSYGKAAAVVIDPARPWRAWMSFGSNEGPHRVWRTDNYGKDWRLVGYEDTGLPSGAIFSLAMGAGAAAQSSALYAPVEGKGICRSDDAGESWQRVDDGLGGNLRFTKLVTDPSDPATMYVGVATDFEKRGGSGVWRSHDEGRHWTLIANIPERPIVAVAPSDPNVIYVGERDYSSVGKGGIYRSSDRGAAWKLMAERIDAGVGNLARTYIRDVAVDPRDPGTVYVTSVDESYDLSCGKGAFVSRDGGRTWQAMNDGITNLNVENLVLDPNQPDRMYAGTGGNGFFRWGNWAEAKPLPAVPESPLPPDPNCLAVNGWTCTADRRHEITVRDEAFWWGRSYVLARLDTSSSGASVTKEFADLLDLSQAKVVSLRLRGEPADEEALCLSRIVLYDAQGRQLIYEPDVELHTTWVLVELPLRDWVGRDFDRSSVRRIEFVFWVPYASGKPYEFAAGGIRFR
jgi:photosystem II stability/assembly factor-like uncharacterized protein